MSAPHRGSPDRAHRFRRPCAAAGYIETERRGSVGRWLIAVAVLAVLTVVVTIAINMFGGSTRDVQVPDVSGQVSADAIADAAEPRLQDPHPAEAGLQRPARPRDRHRPGRRTRRSAPATRSPSTSPPGPSSARCPTSANLSYADAVEQAHRRRLRELQAASSSPSTPEMKDKVLGTNPAGQPDVGDHQRDHHRRRRGPGDPAGPRRARARPPRAAEQILYGVRLHQDHSRSTVDSTLPAGQVVGTNPPAGQVVAGRHRDSDAGVAGQSVHHARPARHVLGRRRAAAAGAGLDRRARQGRRRRRTAGSAQTRS